MAKPPRNRERVHWDDLRITLAAARAGSIVGAARALDVSASTVSRRLAALEETLAVRLFERTAQGLEATPSGQTLIELAEHVEARLAATREALDTGREDLAGRVTLTTFEGLGFWVAERLQGFRERYPQVQLSLEVARQMLEVRPGQADLALWAAVRPRSELVGRKVAKVAFAIYGHRAQASDLSRSPWVVFDGSRERVAQGRWEAQNVAPERVAVRVSSRALFVDLVCRGLGMGVLPCALADDKSELVRLGPNIEELARPLWLLHSEGPQSTRTLALMDFLVEVITQERDSLAGVISERGR